MDRSHNHYHCMHLTLAGLVHNHYHCMHLTLAGLVHNHYHCMHYCSDDAPPSSAKLAQKQQSYV